MIDLPTRTTERLLLAMTVHPAEEDDLRMLRTYGWELLDPADVASTPEGYRRFVQRSKGEFGLAKSGYVASRSGWFSDRSACYLASGRPVLAQDTGCSAYLPTGHGSAGLHQRGGGHRGDRASQRRLRSARPDGARPGRGALRLRPGARAPPQRARSA